MAAMIEERVAAVLARSIAPLQEKLQEKEEEIAALRANMDRYKSTATAPMAATVEQEELEVRELDVRPSGTKRAREPEGAHPATAELDACEDVVQRAPLGRARLGCRDAHVRSVYSVASRQVRLAELEAADRMDYRERALERARLTAELDHMLC